MKNDFQQTALMLAAGNCFSRIIPHIIEAELHQIDYKGQTALIYAITQGHIESALLLLDEQGVIDINGKNALYYAIQHNTGQLFQLLEEKEFPHLQELFAEYSPEFVQNQHDVFKPFIASKTKQNLPQNTEVPASSILQIQETPKRINEGKNKFSKFRDENETMLMFLAKHNCIHYMAKFVHQSCFQNKFGIFALYLAARNNAFDAIKYLCCYESHLETKNHDYAINWCIRNNNFQTFTILS